MEINFEKELISVARKALEFYLQGKDYVPSEIPWPKAYEEANGAFVTLYENNQLRGCIGRHARLKQSIAQEVAELAIYAGTEDPRFPPVNLVELSSLQIEVSLLSIPEAVSDLSRLDPKVYGVIVTNGARSATLLPDIEGVDTVEDQIAITRRKAGISPSATIAVQRFSIFKLKEGKK